MVKSEIMYGPQGFVEAVTGRCYIFRSDTISGLMEEIDECLAENQLRDLWDYPLSEIDEIVHNDVNVVLVELTGENDDGEWVAVYRWYEVPENFTEE